MSGIAQIIQAMMSVTPQVTPMGQGFAGGGGGGGIGLSNQTSVGMAPRSRRSRPQQQGIPQMPEISPHMSGGAPPPGQMPPGQMGPPPGQIGPQQGQMPPGQMGPPQPQGGPPQMGPPQPQPQMGPQQPGQMPEGAPDPTILQRRYYEAAAEVEKYQNPMSVSDAWDSREKLPEARAKLAQAVTNINSYNQFQEAAAARQRGQRVLAQAQELGFPQDQAMMMADAAASDPQQEREIQKALLERAGVLDERRFDQSEEAKSEFERGAAMTTFGIPEAAAAYLAKDEGLTVEQAVKLWFEDQDRIALEAENFHKDQAKIRDSMFEADQAILTTEKALGDVGLSTAGFGAYLKDIGGIAATDLHEALETLRAMTGFKALYDMRQASPTGGALGNVSNMEVKLLYSAWTNLAQKQSPERLRQNLNEMLDRYKRVRFLIEKEQSGELKGMNAIEQKRMADKYINQTHIDAFREMRPATADQALEYLKNGDITKQEFEETYGFLPITGTY